MKRLLLIITLLNFFTITVSAQWEPVGNKMKTKWAEQVSPENVWSEYPRPQFVRHKWENLNGLWEYAILPKSSSKPDNYQGNILVPFCLESSLSGVGKEFTSNDRLWYRRSFNVPDEWKEKDVILNFEAVDYSATVWLNGAFIGAHKGAYDRFSFNITSYLQKQQQNELVVCVDDPSSFGTQPRGKQQIPPQGIFYTPVSGIWQTVWMEAVSNEAYIEEVKLVPDIDNETISITPVLNKPLPKGYAINVEVFDGDEKIITGVIQQNTTLSLKINSPKLWSPDNPFLYDLKLSLENSKKEILDNVESYFGMRKISLGDGNGNKVLMLNNQPVFQYGTLDQGWWPDGLHTPPSDEAMKYDIEVTKQMGFNMIRKHIKVEPDRWYYHCDKLGILVWQDMPSAMAVLPKDNTGEKHPEWLQFVPHEGADLQVKSEDAAQYEFELRRMIDIHYNAPSIIMWVPFNEGWGQYATCRISDAVKALDPSRLVNAVSGWSLRTCGDVYDIHTYHVELIEPPTSLNMATVIGEFGGIGYPVKNHLWNPKMRNWGYQTYKTQDELLKHYKYKFNQIVEMKKNKGLSAAVYTQTTDVEGEVNGLMTYDREVIKIPKETLFKLHSVLFDNDTDD